jgi:hypothetical protein
MAFQRLTHFSSLMLTLATSVVLLVLNTGAARANPLFDELRMRGVAIDGRTNAPLPAPTMADGLDAAAQHAVLEKIVGDRYPTAEFVRNSVVSPMVLKFRDVRAGDAVARGVDLWFVVYGELDDLAGVDVLETFTTARGKETTIRTLTADELAARGLTSSGAAGGERDIALGETDERFVHTVVSILEKVELHQTSRCVLSRSAESVLIASQVDPRFNDDRQFPNVYHRLVRSELGEISKGPPQPYGGAGGYLKATRLAAPDGAILVEYHLLFSEPRDWFNGANLLQSKLPVLLQSRVRALRRELK